MSNQSSGKPVTSTSSGKKLRIETLEDRGHQCTKRVQTCSKCKQAGHNTV